LIIDIYEQRRGAGWEIEIKRISPSEESPRTVRADPNGHFNMRDLSAGTYRVTLKFPDGWRAFTPAAFEVTLNGTSPECAEVRFKMEALANLEVIKLDNGGSMGFGTKIGIPGWEITIKPAGGGTPLVQTTDAKGRAYFPNLAPGEWLVAEQPRDGWRPVPGSPGFPNHSTIIVLASPYQPGDYQSVTFINEQVDCGFIAVKKQDPAGRPLAGWVIDLTRVDGTWPPRREVTNPNGDAYFTCLQMGEWKVREEVQNGWESTGPVEQPVTLVKPGEGIQVTFTNEPLGCVEGYKINHLEEGLSGWQIEARNAETGEVRAALTDDKGYFKLMLNLGTWTLSEVMQAGWTAVTPSEFTIDIIQPFNCEHVRFKNRTNFACVDVYKKDDFDQSGLASWVINIKPAFGGVAQQDLTDGTGWVRFNELAPGTYDIWETPGPGWVAVGPSKVTIMLQASGHCEVVTFFNRQENNYPPRSNRPNVDWSPTPTGAGACRASYTVRPGDTLYRIAVNHGVAWKDLQAVNRLANPRLITPGMVLCIP
jgi:hypothetical protein